MERKIVITAGQKEEQRTIRSVLKDAGFSEHQIRSLKFRERGICVNGQRRRVTEYLRTGDRLEVLVSSEMETGTERWDEDSLEKKDQDRRFGKEKPDLVADCCEEHARRRLEVLYEDEDLIVVNKPAGIPTHRGRGHYRDSAADLVEEMCRAQGKDAGSRVCGRLDLETSGVLVFARHRMAAARLAKQRKNGQMVKEYAAWVKGIPEPKAGRIALPIGKTLGSLNRMEVRADGKYAATCYRVVETRGDSALVLCRLETGRTHQIRVHMAAAGHPLLFDSLYGEAKSGYMTALHAWKLEMFQPFTGEEIQITAPADRIEFC